MQGTVFSSIISTEAMSWRWFCQKLGEMGSFACNIWHLLTDASLTGAKSLEVLQNAALPSLFIALHLVAVVGIVALGAALFAQPALVALQGSTAEFWEQHIWPWHPLVCFMHVGSNSAAAPAPFHTAFSDLLAAQLRSVLSALRPYQSVRLL